MFLWCLGLVVCAVIEFHVWGFYCTLSGFDAFALLLVGSLLAYFGCTCDFGLSLCVRATVYCNFLFYVYLHFMVWGC